LNEIAPPRQLNRSAATSDMKVLISSTLILLCCSGSLSAQRCKCSPPAAGETTRSGANEHIVVLEKRKHARIAGNVRDVNGEILSDVLVEVFDKPGRLLLPYPQNIENQKPQRRIAACVVGSDGQFCFANIPPGKYEVRFSKNGGWNHTSLVLSVGPRGRNAPKRNLEITMQVGT
jgi:protocatechuate 3,4-dioxygenase beta subunit